MAKDLHMAEKSAEHVKKSEMVKKAQEEFAPVQAFFTKFNNDWSMTFGGALAYSLLTAVAPIVIALISILGFILGPSQIHKIMQVATTILPALSSQQDVIQHGLNQLSNQAGFLALIAVLLALFGGSRLFIGLEGFLDIVYRVRPRTFIPQNIMAIIMMLLFIILVPIMFFAATLPSFILQFVSTVPTLKMLPFISVLINNPVTTYLVGALGGLLAAFIFFITIYIVVPNQRISLRNSWLGALVSAIALELFITIVFPFYTAYFMKNYVGQAGFAIVLLVFFYYFAVILILGAEINAFFLENVRPLPNDLVTFVSTMVGKLNRDIPETEFPSHINPQSTDLADRAHIASTREREEENQLANSQKQEQIVSKTRSKFARRARKSHTKQPGKLPTALGVVLGSILTIVIELLRQRQWGK
ncbi:MAG TPA: YihY/virulence factor BrkB family protein [Ktedonobacteraceae bacterium]